MVGEIIRICLELAGALALFMYGMQLTSDGIQRAAGDRLQRTVNFMTKNRFMSVFTGVLVTILIQSSSATTVMVVSFVNAGLLSLVQSIGVIMGANIGTTLTGWIVAAVGVKKFSIVALAVPIFGLGFFMSLMKKRGTTFTSYGVGLMGFALIFLGLEFLAKAIPDPTGDALLFLQSFSDKGWIATLVCVLVGTVFTMLINASSATIAITIGLAAKGIIDFPMAAAITLGANIGTTFDSFLVSLGANTNAKRAAWAHILFNVFGTIWVVLFLDPILRLVDWVTPGEITATTAGAHIAMLHTLFNALNTVVLFPFVRQYAALVSWLIKEKPGEAEARKKLAYSAGPVLDIPELNLVNARKEIGSMAGVARTMFSRFRADVKEQPSDIAAEVEWFRDEETYADRMQEELTHFLLEVSRQSPAEKTQANIQHLLRVVDELENITDSCMSLALLLERCRNKGLVLDKEELEALAPYTLIADEFLRFVEENAAKPISEAELALAAEFEQKLDDFRSSLKKKARKRLKAGADVKTELLFIDLVRHVEKIGDYAFSISESLREMR
ncbi:MAG: Na/Pi cotransporter family protein [Spirochaetaceae bacterium]|nr:Na/Pi cotransporter family protein [Spirochaetaceae bacterium]